MNSSQTPSMAIANEIQPPTTSRFPGFSTGVRGWAIRLVIAVYIDGHGHHWSECVTSGLVDQAVLSAATSPAAPRPKRQCAIYPHWVRKAASADVFGDGPRAVFVHGSFGWGLDTFPEQVALADEYQVVLVDRRGYGRSDHVDEPGWHHDVDDVLAWVGEGAHLVGQSYGGVVCLLAAAAVPEAVRSLTVIEPVATSAAADDPVVAELSARLGSCYAEAPALDAAQFLDAWYRAIGRAGEPDTSTYSAADWRAVEAARRERAPMTAEVDVAALRALRAPKLVVTGGWPGYPEHELLRDACSRIATALAPGIGADLVRFDQSAHNPQIDEAERFNDLLRTFWRSTAT